MLNAGALAMSLYAVTAITYEICGLNFSNPIVALLQITSASIFIPQSVPGTYNLNVSNGVIRCAAPFVGSLIAALCFNF